MPQILRANRLGVLKQQLYPGGELARQRRAALAEDAPGLLDLAEDLGLGDQLALQAAGKAQQKGVGLATGKALQRAVGRKFTHCRRAGGRPGQHRDAALAGIDQEQVLTRGGLGRRARRPDAHRANAGR